MVDINSLKIPGFKVQIRTRSILPSKAVPLKLYGVYILPEDLIKMKILIQWVVAEILHFNKVPGQVSAVPSKNHTLSSLDLRDVWPSF